MPSATDLVSRRLGPALPTWRQAAGVDLAFGGVVDPSTSSLRITCAVGTKTRALTEIDIRVGTGLGGKALAISRTASVGNYELARGITHHYDQAARREGLVSVAAVPIIVNGSSRAVVYVAATSERQWGDRWLDAVDPLRRRLQHELLVEDEVQARLAQLQEAQNGVRSGPSAAEIAVVVRELGELSAELGPTEVAARLGRIRQRLVGGDAVEHGLAFGEGTQLTRREVQVLVEASRGLSNRQIADRLGLLPNTVKSYLQDLMRKLGCTNRVQAIARARDAGWIS